MTQDNCDWAPVTVALSYRLGEIPLFSLALKGYAWRKHFTESASHSTAPLPSIGDATKSNFYFYPTYPVSFEPPRLCRSDRWLIYTPYTFENYYVDLRSIGTFSEYLKKFSSKTRSTLLRKVRKFEQVSGGTIDWRSYQLPDEMDEFFQIAGPLSARTYQARLLDSGLPESSEFLAEAKRLAAAGQIRAFSLYLREKPIAYVFCFWRNGIVTYDYVGYDKEAATHSPGVVLQYHILQRLFEEKECRIFDFTEGAGAHKMLFGTSSQRCAKSYVMRFSVKNRVALMSHQCLNSTVESIGVLLDRFGLKARIRSMIRKVA